MITVIDTINCSFTMNSSRFSNSMKRKKEDRKTFAFVRHFQWTRHVESVEENNRCCLKCFFLVPLYIIHILWITMCVARLKSSLIEPLFAQLSFSQVSEPNRKKIRRKTFFIFCSFHIDKRVISSVKISLDFHNYEKRYLFSILYEKGGGLTINKFFFFQCLKMLCDNKNLFLNLLEW